MRYSYFSKGFDMEFFYTQTIIDQYVRTFENFLSLPQLVDF